MKAKAIVRKAIKITNSIEDYIVLMVVVLFIAFAVYALWDSDQLHFAADKSHYAVYKPTAENQGKSFKELQALNPDIFAWLTVYGTHIDYPVAQGENNMKYVNTNAEGQYSLSGAIFLDAHNSKDFSDFNSILYGHHMARNVMFGDIDTFADKNMFDSHKYGNLYFDGIDHGIEFFAFVHTDAYDSTIFVPNVKGEQRQIYLDGLLSKAMYTRDIGITTEDHIVLLSTCSSSSTNGRDILIGRVTDEVYEDSTINTTTTDGIIQTDPDNQYCLVKGIHIIPLLLALLAAVWIICYIFVTYHRYKKYKNGGKIYGKDTHTERKKGDVHRGSHHDDTDRFDLPDFLRGK